MPKKTDLLTNWLTIGTAGPTVDGREIPEALLEQAAANYDPDEYTAVINSDHLLGFYGNFGSVAELQTAKDKKGRTVLQARLAPNKRLLQMNTEGQRLFTSMELVDNFADSGEGYLVGLAVTDMPASLGTTELKFSKRGKAPDTLRTPAQVFTLEGDDDPSTEQSEQCTEGKDAHLFSRLLAFLKSETATPPVAGNDHTDPDEDDDMKPEQFDAMMAAFKSLEAKLAGTAEQAAGDDAATDSTTAEFSALAEQVKALSAQVDALTNAASQPEGNQDDKGSDDDGAAKFAQLGEQLTALQQQFTALMQERPDGRNPAGTGAQDTPAFV